MTSTATLEFPAEVQLPFELRDDEHQYEIVDGNRLEKPAMSTISTRLSFLIAHYLELFVSANRLGRAFMEQIFWLNKSRKLARRPDAAYVSYDRWPEDKPLLDTDPWDLVPELAVEVMSPSNSSQATEGKIEEYFEAGVQLVWLVYPKLRKVYVYQSATEVRILTHKDVLDGGSVLPEFRLPLTNIFGPLP